jgi:hypothetical protein
MNIKLHLICLDGSKKISEERFQILTNLLHTRINQGYTTILTMLITLA